MLVVDQKQPRYFYYCREEDSRPTTRKLAIVYCKLLIHIGLLEVKKQIKSIKVLPKEVRTLKYDFFRTIHQFHPSRIVSFFYYIA